MNGILRAVFFTCFAIACSKELNSTHPSLLTNKKLETKCDPRIIEAIYYVTIPAMASIVSLKTVDGINFCGGVLFTKRHVIVPAICVITLYGADYKDVHVWLGVFTDPDNAISRRIGDLNVDRRGKDKIAVITLHKAVKLTKSISVIHLATEQPTNIVSSLGYNQIKGHYLANFEIDFEKVQHDCNIPIPEPEPEPKPFSAKPSVYKRVDNGVIMGVTDMELGHAIIFKGQLYGMFLENDKKSVGCTKINKKYTRITRDMRFVKDIVVENEELN